MSKNKLKKYFTLLIVIYPIFSVYGIPELHIPFILMILFLFDIIIIIYDKFTLSANKLYFLFFIYVLLQTVYVLYLRNNDAVLNTMHYLFYLINIVFFCKRYFDTVYACKIVVIISLAACMFLFLQYILLQIFGYYLPGTIPGIPVLRNELTLFNETMYSSYINENITLRSRSFFSEPSGFGSFVILGLLFELFKSKESIMDYFCSIVITLGLFLIRSNTAWILMIIVWISYFFIVIFPNINKTRNICFFIIIVLLMIIFLNTETFNIIMQRLSSDSASVNGRFGSISIVFSGKMNTIMLGHGMIELSETVFLPDLFLSVYYFGIIGTLLFFVPLIYELIIKNPIAKIVIGILLFSSIGGGAFIGIMAIQYLPYLEGVVKWN